MSREHYASAVVLTDWGAKTEGLSASRDALLQELLLLSLVYDQLLIQDEVLALSTKLARWFTSGKDFDLLRRCLSIGSIVILTHHAYGSDDLAELALRHPISARAKYIARRGTKEEKRFTPSEQQERFYELVDVALRDTRALRPVGSLDHLDIMPAFASLLASVLRNPVYAHWLRSGFRGLTRRAIDEFAEYVEHPPYAVRALRDAGIEPQIVEEGGQIVFNRSLAYQLSKLFDQRTARALKKLAASTFIAPFCWREHASGRFSRHLREVLWSADDAAGAGPPEAAVTVEAVVRTDVPLPSVDDDFVDAIQAVRASEAGKQLRQSVRDLGLAPSFAPHVTAWQDVSGELAQRLRRPTHLTLKSALITIGGHGFFGTVADLGVRFGAGHVPGLPEVLSSAFLGGSLGLCCHHVSQLLRNDLARQTLRPALERAVEFRCSPLPAPPVIATPRKPGDEHP